MNYFLGDHLGSTTALTDASGAITSQTAYDSFGNQTGTLASRYGYTGRERDDFSGLMYYRARFYDPSLGRFTSEDPIGFRGGDANLYGYVRNNPTNFTDPSGLFPYMGGPLIPKRLPWRDGSEFADWGDEKANTAQRFYGGYDPPFSFNPLDPSNPRRFFGTIRGFCDMFRVGEGLGQALYAPDENGWGQGAFVMMDAGRASGLFAMMAGPAAPRAGARSSGNTFPPNPDDLLPNLPRDAKGRVYPSDNIRIRPEKHPLEPGERYSPRHHGQHYHVDYRTDSSKSWNNKATQKSKPPRYRRGGGTGFVPGEDFP